jgi:cobalt transporter subunit CbtB
MTVLVQKNTISLARLMPTVAALLVGLGLVFTAGLSSAAVMHDTAHDVRHAMAFPCH